METWMETSFDSVHFAEGRFRKAYKGIWTNHPSKKGKLCVVKKMKERYAWNESDWDTTVKVYDRTKTLATQFNQNLRPFYPLNVTSVDKLRVVREGLAPSLSGPRLNEYVVVEDYLEGTFKKWCNNYGYISPDAEAVNITMPAFVHWSWLYTRGQEMVCDLQGVRDENGYHLTDPVVLSLSRTYGQTDMGIEGMAMFFLNHQCNDICRGWKRPTLGHFIGKVPQPILSACQAMQGRVNNATTFNFELQFPPHIKQMVTGVFLQIAQS